MPTASRARPLLQRAGDAAYWGRAGAGLPAVAHPFACLACRRAELSKLSEQHGPDYVVTEADMKAATAAAMQAALGGM